jgi:hypothetical protein
MTPFEIALAIRNRADQDESVESFVRRMLSGERVSDFSVALKLLIRWERAYEEIEALLDVLKDVSAKTPAATIGTLIAAKRRLGYDHKLEALLAHRWRCPHCKQFAGIDKIELPIGNPDHLPRCVICGEEGIAPVETEAHLDTLDGGKSGLRPQ